MSRIKVLLSLTIGMMAALTGGIDTASASDLSDRMGDEIRKNDEESTTVIPLVIPVGDEALTTDQVAFRWWEGQGAELRKFLFQLWTNEPVTTDVNKGPAKV